ncbi:uncharacterized protein LOC115774520 [Archocentrus centrarchus]|uniref:uncharacterized protein LOC115774520 n=1 Tax=Archocentrus centrarchus TaxID=63155 RepID=UPI0011EA3D1E|nr:uncharacterized protein LOC115774520 [Archocentrus centrarchus]
MSETLRNYQAILDMEEQQVSWKKFFVYEAGNTNGAHRPIVRWLTTISHTEVFTPEECDYLLVFCPAVSRVGTDIGEALASIPLRRPVILVVMHHTFDRQHVVAESCRQVNDPNVRLTVDCLFYEGRLLDCSLNDIAQGNIWKSFGVSSVFDCRNWIQQRWKRLAVCTLFGCFVTVVIIWLCTSYAAEPAPGNHSYPNKHLG